MWVDAATAAALRTRAHDACEHCLLPERFSGLPHVTDHIIAQQHGGDDTLDNLALSCQRCNLLKGPNIAGLDPSTGELCRLLHPRQDAWGEHFQLATAEITGRTAVGRTTAALLRMNEPGRLSVRTSLLLEGVRLMRSR